MKDVKVIISKGNMVKLPSALISQMQLKDGDEITLEYDPQRLVDKCFIVKDDIENDLKNEYYCIPMCVLNDAGLDNEDLQVILGVKEITITTSNNVLSILPTEIIGAMVDEKVDLAAIADNFVERTNNRVLEMLAANEAKEGEC